MVLQKALESAKDKPKDEKKAIAGGIAIAVVLVLLVSWAFFFFRNIQRGNYEQQLGGGAQDEFNFSSVRDAQQELMEQFSDVNALLEARQESPSGYQPLPSSEAPYGDEQVPFESAQ